MPTVYPNPAAGSTPASGGTCAEWLYMAVAGGGSLHANMPVRFFGTNVIYLNIGCRSAPLFQDTAEVGRRFAAGFSYDPQASLNNVTPDKNGDHSDNRAASLANS